jgi:beta-galactosidase GanA
VHALVNIRRVKTPASALATLAAAFFMAAVTQAAPPHLEKQGSTQQLIVDGKPFLILGGELGNSSASSADYMRPHWPRLKAMNLNTVLAPVSWELIEPTEGKFNWTPVDELLRDARAQDLKLVILWFGAWKNSMSTYVPAWVKRDQKRFPRAQIANESSVEILSAFSQNTRDADVRAFGALMEYLKRVDGDRNTVLMVQVENEIGMLPVARERGPVADKLFAGPVPPELLQSLRRREKLEPELQELWKKRGARMSGTWTEVFGDQESGAEVFTAWHYARFVESLAVAGKKRYDIPLYVNVALNRSGRKPGEYPSGGPLPHLIDVWKAGTPTTDMLTPDIYFPNFVELAARYRRADNTLFIPEANNADKGEVPANAFFAIGELDSLGFSPFSIESVGDRQPNPLADAYSVLKQLAPLILANRGHATMSGFRPRVLEDGTVIDTPVKKAIGDFAFTISFVDPWTPRDKQTITNHGGLLIYAGGEDFWFAGQGLTITFKGARDATLAGIDSAHEGVFDEKGVWKPGRLLNGDQTHQGRHIRLPPGQFQIQKVRFYRY